MTVPIATSPGRAGYGPQLSLSYNSGSGNGIFGLGWGLALPQITRKTDKGLPQYLDCTESDVFLFSGAEDLVPAAGKSSSESEVACQSGKTREVDGKQYRVERYRPRIEGLFARIERWTKADDESDVHWRSYTKINDLTIYGKDAESRIADPEDCSRIFSWLICESRDTKGNVVLYKYKCENGEGVDRCHVHERNRGNANDTRRTANRYIKRILYGNRETALDEFGNRPHFLKEESLDWMFEVVFDYGEHEQSSPTPAEVAPWIFREDPFSNYRSRFEIRTTRRCLRVLMFHHFPDEEGVDNDCLVRSTDFHYDASDLNLGEAEPIYSRIVSVTQAGYKRKDGGYLRKTLPPLEFEYSKPVVQDTIEEVDIESAQNLPIGLDGSNYRWVDLHGEGISGILSEQAGNWYYMPNISPLTSGTPKSSKGENGGARGRFPHQNGCNSQCDDQTSLVTSPRQDTVALFEPTAVVRSKPNTSLAAGAQLLDLAGDGSPDLVSYFRTTAGFYEHEEYGEAWKPFRPFERTINRNLGDPNVKFIDLTGDGRADLLITENDCLIWYKSEGEEGFADHKRVAKSFDEESGPRVVFADAEQSIYTADLSGDGLTDIVRIRNGEVCYWPNIGYGEFGSKIMMDHSPRFDDVEQFGHGRIRLADIDGSGTTDIIYLHRNGVRLYFNQSGNCWSKAKKLNAYPRIDNLNHIVPLDLLGNGTTCLVWSSPLLTDANRPMRYINLMGGTKPHLLITSKNNLGAETEVQYVPSTKFYLQDKRDGKPWITRLPFPIHVVERVNTRDRISGNRFVTRYAYHHGYFDGKEREFRGFGMVEQFDTEEFAFLDSARGGESSTNENAESHVPPVLTRTWFHTGANLGRNRISNYFAGFLDAHDRGEYYREPTDCCTDEDARAALGLLPDTILHCNLSFVEEHEARRALKGSMLRQEIYALDGSGTCDYPFGHPYSVTEQNFTVRKLQLKGDQRHGVFFTHPREVINYHYERNPVDPRISHAITLDVDDYGNVLREAAIAYGRRQKIVAINRLGRKQVTPNPKLAKLDPLDQARQTQAHITFTENQFTHAVDLNGDDADHYLTPQPVAAKTYELTGVFPCNESERFSFDQWTKDDFAITRCAEEILYEAATDRQLHQKRLIESVRTRYRSDDLTSLLPVGQIEPRMLAGESYKLAFTSGLIDKAFKRTSGDGLSETLLSNPSDILAVDPNASAADRGGYVDLDGDGCWWIPTGRSYLSPQTTHSPEQELQFARQHFFLDRRYRDPFHTATTSTETFATYDEHDLLVTETYDAVSNRVNAENDYRVLQPKLVTDPNRNRSGVAFDALGMVVGTVVMGKATENHGDSLENFEADLPEDIELSHLANPLDDPHSILGKATTRLVYDLFAYYRSADKDAPAPAVVYTLARETHESELQEGEQTKIQHSFSYSDGFGREIQKKVQAERGAVPIRDDLGAIFLDENQQPKLTNEKCEHRWVGSGWTVFNNKGKPVRKFEPFFTDTHRFESDVRVGVSSVLFYDPVERVVATLHPNHTYEKFVFDPWKQTTWDVNDTVLLDPRTDSDIAGFVGASFDSQPADWQTWLERRQGGELGELEKQAAEKTVAHAATPTTAYSDSLGRPYLTVTHNRVECSGHDLDGDDDQYETRVELDIEGNQRVVRDSIAHNDDPSGRVVMRYDYDMLGNRIHQASMEAGQRWILSDVTGNPIRSWDSRGHSFTTNYDALRRPTSRLLIRGEQYKHQAQASEPSGVGFQSANPILIERTIYGEQHPEAVARNLRGQAFMQLDQAGAMATEQFDFKGNAVSQSRHIAKEFKQSFDWTPVDAVLPEQHDVAFDQAEFDDAVQQLTEPEVYDSSTTFDALNRPVELTTPHTSDMKPNVIRHRFNEANLLEKVDASLRSATDNDQTVWTSFVSNIDYDAKGQRQRIDYGNGTSTSYQYDPHTFRLTRLLSKRNPASFSDDCPHPKHDGWPGCFLQNLSYTYDPVGNITHIRDDAQQTIFFRNKRVEPSNDYTYDAIYRLIEATGREHLGQAGGSPIRHSNNDAPRVGLPHPGDGGAMGAYIERYIYDSVGNFLQMQHRGSDPQHAGWTRMYAYNETSLTEPAKQSNQLSHTLILGGTPATARYTHDAHGNMTFMPHLGDSHNMHWDHLDQLKQVDLPDGRAANYTYDASGERVRKVVGTSETHYEERLYLGGFEIYRQRKGDDVLERETLHIMDDQQRIALIETRTNDTAETDKSPEQLIRFQLNNHLGSASLELDYQSQIISYEEYTPYGSNSYQAVRSQTEQPKRYRYTGLERDEESGLAYHSARYYSPWIAQWIKVDPEAIRFHTTIDGTKQPRIDLVVGPYRYANGNPIALIDPSGRSPVSKVFNKLARKLATRGATKKAAKAATAEMKKVGGRVASNVGLKGIPSDTMKHIALHFADDATKKGAHTVFAKGLRESKSKLTDAIQKTLRNPSLAPHLSKTDTGHFAIVFERSFGKAIGESGEKILRVVVDHRSKLITAFPAKEAVKTITASGVRVAANRSVLPLAAVAFAGVGEARAAHNESEQKIHEKLTEGHWTDWILPDLLVPSPLGDSSMAPIRRNEAAFDNYAKASQNLIEFSEQRKLNPAERESLRGVLEMGWKGM